MNGFRKPAGKVAALLLALLMAASALPAFAESADDNYGLKYAADQTLRLLYSTEATSLCSFSVSGSANDWQAVANCVEGLVTVDIYGNKVPGLAESWDVSEDQTVYTFHLRKGLQWVDNTGAEKGELTAHDFVAVAHYIVDPVNASGSVIYFDGIIAGAHEIVAGEETDLSTLGFKALDDYTLEATLTGPLPYFISTCGAYMAAYYPLLAELGDSYGLDNESMYFIGPYIMTTFEPEYRRIYEKNPSYYDADSVYIQKIIMSYNAEASTLAPEMFVRGDVDYALLDPALITEWKQDPTKTDIVIPGQPDTTYMYYYGFNYDPLFDAEYEPENWRLAINNENFRQSLYWGLNRYKGLLAQDPYNPQMQQTNTITPVGWCNINGLDFTQVGPMKEISDRENNQFDEAKALEYKAKAVEELTAAGAKFPIKVLMPYNPNLASWELEVQVVKQQLTELLGADYIECIIQAGPSTGFLAEVRRAGKYAFMKLNNGGSYDDPDAWTPAFRPDNTWTFIDKAQGDSIEAQYAEYLSLLREAQAVKTYSEERYEKFAIAEAYLLNHALAIPYCADTEGYFVAKFNPFERPDSSDGYWKGTRVLEEPLTEAQFLAIYADWVEARAASLDK
ncbi:MAG: ABC transporter substrate-binding protein [Oscillospiraceae bacterium]|jgi:oligopeptide transport system substrate-binding protein|nr:ABC transporter substrate-binding protein [Oscillospiraceae bacterium]